VRERGEGGMTARGSGRSPVKMKRW